jgi:hypothetical protein
MFPRQTKLDPILAELRKIPGITTVEQDDWNSTSINVFVSLDAQGHSGSISRKPQRFAKPLRSYSLQIAAVFRRLELNYEVLDRPAMTYYSDQGEKIRDGYSCGHFKLEVYV